MNSKALLNICASALALAAPSMSRAHFLWVSLDPLSKTASLGLQEVPSQDPLPLGARSAQLKVWLPQGRTLGLKTEGNGFKAGTAAGCVGASLDYGVIDRRDGGRGLFWLKYCAKGATTPGTSQSKLGLELELFAVVKNDGSPLITVLHDGKPAQDADLVVEDAEGKSLFDGKTGTDGTLTLPATQGPIEVRALITENTPGVHDGKPYDLIRTYSTLTVKLPSEKPLTRLLRESFGDMHDVVSNSQFIKTVMAGTLTKAQLVDHLQQRALIHEAIDEEFRKARLGGSLYGQQQREVLTLLRGNIQSLGASWPKPSSAWPLTKDFLKEMRESAKAGPYFMLGVFHVYYGGITHGGRDIGAMIDQQLKSDLTYYEKSDGYEDYVREVDAITDPDAQKEMIRGADEAYRYIIAVNNLDVFKASH